MGKYNQKQKNTDRHHSGKSKNTKKMSLRQQLEHDTLAMIEHSIMGFLPLFICIAAMRMPIMLGMPISHPTAMTEETWMLMMLSSHVCGHGGEQGAAVHAPLRPEGAEVHMRVMTLHMHHHVMHYAKDASTADVNAWELHLCVGFHVAPQQRWICESHVTLRTLVWSLMGGMETHVISKCLLAATALTADCAPELVPMNIAEMSVIFVLHEEMLATLFAAEMAVQDCLASSPGAPFQALALVSTLGHI